MNSHDATSRRFALALSLLAGFIDALGFLSLGGFFVSFMSGNSTQFSINLAQFNSIDSILLPLGMVVLFVTGVITGKVIRHLRPHHASMSILSFMSVVLMIAAVFLQLDFKIISAGFMAVAMGAANNVFVREGEVSIGVTYMTGTLVKFGQRLADQLLGGKKNQWQPHLSLWGALIIGSLFGTLSYIHFHAGCLWLAAFFCVTLALIAKKIKL